MARIQFVAYQDGPSFVARYYQAADVYVHAAKADTFPNSGSEAARVRRAGRCHCDGRDSGTNRSTGERDSSFLPATPKAWPNKSSGCSSEKAFAC